jgi:hypothetical protein
VNLSRDRWLGYVKACRSAPETALFCNCYEVSQLPQIHSRLSIPKGYRALGKTVLDSEYPKVAHYRRTALRATPAVSIAKVRAAAVT